jgi:hypothetical protein
LLLDALPETVLYYFFPVLYQLDEVITGDIGTLNEDGSVKLPNALRLTYASLNPKGVFLLDNGMTTYFWLGAECNVEIAKHLKYILINEETPEGNDEVRVRIERIVQAIKEYFVVKN